MTGGGPVFLQQNELTDFAYFTHNTFVNNKKNWLLSPYYRTLFVVNNIFINQNWVGEDTNMTSSGMFTSTINVDSVSAQKGVVVQGKYYVGDSSYYSHELDLTKLRIFVSNNINYYDPLLVNGYYASSTYVDSTLGTPPSYLDWIGSGSGPWKIGNQPGVWMNTRTKAFFAASTRPNGGLLEHNTYQGDPFTVTPGIADASVVTMMAQWNQNQWGDPRFPTAPDIVHSKYIFGDYDPTTLPGIVNGVKTDTMTAGAAGITKFTDLTENFSQHGLMSDIDGLPVGALIWNDAEFAAYSSAAEWALVYRQYEFQPLRAVKPGPGAAAAYSLAQNYPNPFNPSTKIQFTIVNRLLTIVNVYDVLGREVATLVNEVKEPGTCTVEFSAKGGSASAKKTADRSGGNASSLASGVYFYRLNAGQYVECRKMVMMK